MLTLWIYFRLTKTCFKLSIGHTKYFQVKNMINFLKDNVENGSVIIIAVRDSTLSTHFTGDQVAYMRRLGQTSKCSVKTGLKLDI